MISAYLTEGAKAARALFARKRAKQAEARARAAEEAKKFIDIKHWQLLNKSRGCGSFLRLARFCFILQDIWQTAAVFQD